MLIDSPLEQQSVFCNKIACQPDMGSVCLVTRMRTESSHDIAYYLYGQKISYNQLKNKAAPIVATS